MTRLREYLGSNTLNLQNYNKLTVFLLTSIGYAIVHCNRKTFSTVKHDMIKIWTKEKDIASFRVYPEEVWDHRFFDNEADAANFQGVLDFLFMFFYAVGLYFSGYFADRTNPTYVFSIGMVLASIVTVLFGYVTEQLHFYNKAFYGITWCLNGLIQSTSWPAAIGIMGSWFKGKQGLVFGLWSSATASGNILADILCGYIVDYGYDMTFLVNANIMAAFGLICFVSLESSPEKICPYEPIGQEIDSDMNDSESVAILNPINTSISYLQILKIPGVVLYSVAYACIKLVNYALFFWLPLYLSASLKWSSSMASKASAAYDVGGIVGSIFAGLLSDLPYRCISKHCVNYVLLILNIPAVLAYKFTPGYPVELNCFVMFIMGFLMGGPVTIISAVFSVDLNRMPEYKGTKIISTVSGIIDGTGSFGAALGQIFVPMLGYALGWYSIFYFFIICLITCLLIISPIFIRDVKSRRRVQSVNETVDM